MEKQRKNDGSAVLRGKAAHSAIKKCFVQLIPAVTISNIPANLYANGLIDEQLLDHILNKSQTDSDKGMKIIRHIQKIIEIEPSKFDDLCSVLNQEDETKKIAEKLKGMYLILMMSCCRAGKYTHACVLVQERKLPYWPLFALYLMETYTYRGVTVHHVHHVCA